MSKSNKSIVYYLWRYPILSQTFIQREISALKKELRPIVHVIADAPGNLDILDDDARQLVEDTLYLQPINKMELIRYCGYFLLWKPLVTFKIFFYIIFQKYSSSKSLKEDLIIFLKAALLAGILRERFIDHIHSPWSDVTAFIAMVAAKLAGIPFTLQARAHDVHRKSSTYSLQEKFHNAEFIITNSKYNASHLCSFINQLSLDKIHVIYNGIQLNQFRPENNIKQGSAKIKVLSVGRLIEQKGYVYLLKACKMLKDEGIDFQFDIIGGPEEPLYSDFHTRLRELHNNLGLEDCVSFLGAQPFTRVLDAYQDADIFVLPCVLAADGSRDITPNSLIEAMAMKLPVISTNVTAIPEIIQDSVSGLIIPPEDENILMQKIIELINNPKRRKQLGENARKKVEQQFNINKNVLEYVSLFHNV